MMFSFWGIIADKFCTARGFTLYWFTHTKNRKHTNTIREKNKIEQTLKMENHWHLFCGIFFSLNLFVNVVGRVRYTQCKKNILWTSTNRISSSALFFHCFHRIFWGVCDWFGDSYLIRHWHWVVVACRCQRIWFVAASAVLSNTT